MVALQKRIKATSQSRGESSSSSTVRIIARSAVGGLAMILVLKSESLRRGQAVKSWAEMTAFYTNIIHPKDDEADTRTLEERMRRYEKEYKYQPPAPRQDVNANVTVCGYSPNYTTYFEQPRFGRNLYRSVNNEDKTVYGLFPDIFRALGPKGHYIELGAFDGLTESNTRFFDECLGWDGLLLEGNPVKYDALTENRPHAHRMSFAPSCSLEEEMQNKTVEFHAVSFTNGGLEGFANDYASGWKLVDVPCGSLTSVIQDVMGGRIHFFSLDVEGSEPSVLKNIDFTKVMIDIIIVESFNNQCPKEPQECKTREQAREIMKAAGYKRYINVVVKSDLYIHPNSEFQLTREPDGRRRHL